MTLPNATTFEYPVAPDTSVAPATSEFPIRVTLLEAMLLTKLYAGAS